jgi:Glycosyl hydrolase family 26
MSMEKPRGHRFRRGLAPLVAILLGACLLVLPAVAAAKKKHPSRPLYWGAQIGTQYTGTQPPWDMNAVSDFERTAGKKVSLVAFYSPFADCTVSPCEFYGFPGVPMENIRRHGSIPFFSWSSSSTDKEEVRQPGFRLARIADGTYDAFIESFAENAREWGHPFFLRFNWEMNGFWFPWGEDVNGNRPGQFVAAWRHVHDIFARMGATNATWVWCPNIGLARRLQHLGPLYPGDAYVDWTCLDGFNWGPTSNSPGWMSFNKIFRSSYERVLKLAPHKPMVIGETASEEIGGSKAAWIRNALGIIPTQYPKVRALVWFDEKTQGRNWPVNSSKSSRASFRKAISHPIFMRNFYSGQPAGKIAPPTWTPPPPEAPAPPVATPATSTDEAPPPIEAPPEP